MTKTTYYSVLAVIVTSFLAVFLASTWFSEPALGATIQGNDYIATSTAPNGVFGARTAASLTLTTGGGSLGNVIITGANTGVLNFYDATTTNINLRTGQTATSSILLFSVPASAVAGEFVIDAQFTTGLTYDLFGGIMPTTTITYRK